MWDCSGGLMSKSARLPGSHWATTSTLREYLAAGVGRTSYRHGLPADHVSESSGKCAFGDKVDFHAQQVAQVHKKTTLIEQRAPRLEADDQVDIRGFGGVAPCDLAENPHV